MKYFLIFLTGLCSASGTLADEKPEYTDYCKQLEHEIQGRKHGFLAGNVTYYVGGFHASWNLIEDETIGLTHPIHHDLRSRGVGRLESQIQGAENTGVGNDFSGWEFYKDTRVLYGSVMLDGEEIKTPKPTSMLWRPDKMICVYELDGVTIREEKFIAANDAAVSVITASRPIELRFEGHSFYHRNSVSSTASMQEHSAKNVIAILEGGQVKSIPDPDRSERIGPHVYTGMTTVVASSHDFAESATTRVDERGVQHYSFKVPCDQNGTAVGWAMHDDPLTAVTNVQKAIKDRARMLKQKTLEMNRLLNEEVPWFRCPDKRFVDTYYYLWALYLMYYIDVGEEWEQESHTQTAVNNFLGMHRYDAAFQIKVGAWTRDKSKFAYGNVLTWKHLTENHRFKELDNGIRMLSDNKGRSWHSGAYGGETSEHVKGAWQIYEHTGDTDFLRQCYEGHFRTLFWDRLTVFAMNSFEVYEILEQMAALTGNDKDVGHWRDMYRREPAHIRRMFADRWEVNGISNFFAGPRDGMMVTNSFWAMRSKHFPKEYAEKMVQTWAFNKDEGFYGDFFPLAMSKRAMQKFKTPVDHSFGYTPDTAYFTLDGMFQQGLTKEATELTLNHIENYNWSDEWNVPVAPEAYRRDGTLFGDQYSNFNAGKILLYIEGLAGISYSVRERRIVVSPALPKAWEWMEVRLPVDDQWIRIRYSPDGIKSKGVKSNWKLLTSP